jgi:hypothetical protein
MKKSKKPKQPIAKAKSKKPNAKASAAKLLGTSLAGLRAQIEKVVSDAEAAGRNRRAARARRLLDRVRTWGDDD